MNQLKNLMELSEFMKLEHDINMLENCFTELKNLHILNEAVTDLPSGDLNMKLDIAERRIAAAKRGLGLVNKLPTKEERQYHKSRMMKNLNILRALLNDIINAISVESTVQDISSRYELNRREAF